MAKKFDLGSNLFGGFISFNDKSEDNPKAPKFHGRVQSTCAHCGVVTELWASAWSGSNNYGDYLRIIANIPLKQSHEADTRAQHEPYRSPGLTRPDPAQPAPEPEAIYVNPDTGDRMKMALSIGQRLGWKLASEADENNAANTNRPY